jgi:hypothetical protein
MKEEQKKREATGWRMEGDESEEVTAGGRENGARRYEPETSVTENAGNMGDRQSAMGDLALGRSVTVCQDIGDSGPTRVTVGVQDIGDSEATCFVNALESDLSHG